MARGSLKPRGTSRDETDSSDDVISRSPGRKCPKTPSGTKNRIMAAAERDRPLRVKPQNVFTDVLLKPRGTGELYMTLHGHYLNYFTVIKHTF